MPVEPSAERVLQGGRKGPTRAGPRAGESRSVHHEWAERPLRDAEDAQAQGRRGGQKSGWSFSYTVIR
jgi:hypothetical protein